MMHKHNIGFTWRKGITVHILLFLVMPNGVVGRVLINYFLNEASVKKNYG
jgi:hypothetical protein